MLQRVFFRAQHIQLLLGKVADVQALALGHLAGQCLHFTGNGLDQGGFTLAVGAQDAYALACEHGAAHVPQDHGFLILLVGIAESSIGDG
ncbi:hypothetical protein D3C72_1599230 [compost metagenome]